MMGSATLIRVSEMLHPNTECARGIMQLMLLAESCGRILSIGKIIFSSENRIFFDEEVSQVGNPNSIDRKYDFQPTV
jgi:hypothetical protein